MSSCRNCGFPVEDKYCGHCGQKSPPERITFKYIWHEIFHFFSHMENGFLFTSSRLITKPGSTVLNFIEGKRKYYQPPVSYFLIWIAVFTLFLYLLEKVFGEGQIIDYHDYFGRGPTTKIALSHLALIITAVIPFQALYVYIFITKSLYNYLESLVMVVYLTGTIILFQFIYALLSFIVFLISHKPVILQYSDLFKAAYGIWFVTDLACVLPVRLKPLRIIICLIFAFGTFTFWRAYLYPYIASHFNA